MPFLSKPLVLVLGRARKPVCQKPRLRPPDPGEFAEWPKIGLLNRGFGRIWLVFPRRKQQNTELTKFLGAKALQLVSPDCLSLRHAIFFARDIGRMTIFDANPLKMAIFPRSCGKNRTSQGVENQGSLIIVPLPLRFSPAQNPKFPFLFIIPYQALHSLNAWTPFSEEALSSLISVFVASPSQNYVHWGDRDMPSEVIVLDYPETDWQRQAEEKAKMLEAHLDRILAETDDSKVTTTTLP